MSDNLREPFWVEVLDRHQAVVSRQRAHDGKMSIGRAYENDLIIDDPFVAPLHLLIGYDDEGALWIEDLAGNKPADANTTPTRMLVGPEASIRIGNTSLRIRTRAYAVPPALSLAGQAKPSFASSAAARGLLCAVAFLALSVLATWLTQTVEFKMASYLPVLVIFPLFVIGWAGMWALVTRIMTSHAQFARHIFIVFAWLLGFFFVDLATDVLAYAWAWTQPQRWLAVASWGLLGLLVFAHLTVITPRHRRLTAGIVGVLAIAAIAVHTSLRMESDRVQPQRIVAQLMPTFLIAKSPVTPENFFKEVDSLRPKLEEASKKEPTAGGISLDDFD